MATALKKKNTRADIDRDDEDDDIDIDEVKEKPVKKEKPKKEKKEKPKKEKKEKKEKKNGESRGGIGGIILIFFVLALIVGFLVAVLRFNAFGLRDNQLRGILEKIPIVNNTLPPLEQEDPVSQMSLEEMSAEIETLKASGEQLQAEVDRLEALNSTYLGEINVLREFEENQVQFRQDKEAFDREVGLGDPVGYEKYYAQVSPENAENIYREVVGIIENDKEFKNFVSTYENMDESSAAKIFDQMVRTNLDLVVRILLNISSEQRAAIMGAMTTTAAEQATRRMAPVE